MRVKNLGWIRTAFDPRLHEALAGIQQDVTADEIQGNLNPYGEPDTPPPIQGLRVNGKNGYLNVAITDQAIGVKRGISYQLELDTDPGFSSPQFRDIGPARNHSELIGNKTIYVRATSAYANSPASPAVYHGSQVKPTPVVGGGTMPAVEWLESQGAGTGAPRQGLYGPGPVQIRTQKVAQGPTATGSGGLGTPAGFAASSMGGLIPNGSGGFGADVIQDTADHLVNYPSVNYPDGTEYWKTDYTVLYMVNDATGTVNTSGTSVVGIGGIPFNMQWIGKSVTINGVSYTWATITNGTAGTLTTSAGTQTGVAYTQPRGGWFYRLGVYLSLRTSPPVGLGLLDAGFKWEVDDYGHQLYWNGSGYGTPKGGFADGSSSNYYVESTGSSPVPSQYFVPVTSGGSAQYLRPDGTLGTVTFPTFTGNEVKRMGSSFVGTPTSPTAPTFVGGAFTGADTGTTQQAQAYATGTPVAVPAEPHTHTLNNTNSVLNPLTQGDGGQETSITLPPYFRI